MILVQYVTFYPKSEFWDEVRRIVNVIFEQHHAVLEINEDNISLKILRPTPRTDSYVHLISRMCKEGVLSCWKETTANSIEELIHNSSDVTVKPGGYYDFISPTRNQKAQAYLSSCKKVLMEKRGAVMMAKGLLDGLKEN